MAPTVALYTDDGTIRHSNPKSLRARGERIAREANRAYAAGDFALAAKLARQCEALALRLEAPATVALWRDRAESAEAMVR